MRAPASFGRFFWPASLGVGLCGLLLTAAALSQGTSPTAASELEGTSWQLVKIEGSDAKIHVPSERGHYLLAFAPRGELSARIDCNRGSGTWSSPEGGRLVLGELATTRAQCAPGSLYDEIIAHWTEVRTYALRDGHLILTGGGGVYEYEPLPVPGAGPAAPPPGTASH
jgi:heat shock protein HslJ